MLQENRQKKDFKTIYVLPIYFEPIQRFDEKLPDLIEKSLNLLQYLYFSVIFS